MDHHSHVHGQATDTSKEYQKLFLVFGFIFVVSLLLAYTGGDWHWMLVLDYIMGVFFLTFGLFKLLEYKTFAHGYKDYDLLAKRFKSWGYAYPVVEVLLGGLYIIHFMPLYLNAFTVVLLSINAYGVHKTTHSKSDRQPACLCLGSVVKLPLSTISLLENILMGLMALVMLAALMLGYGHPVA